jgi:hypothetical protein
MEEMQAPAPPATPTLDALRRAGMPPVVSAEIEGLGMLYARRFTALERVDWIDAGHALQKDRPPPWESEDDEPHEQRIARTRTRQLWFAEYVARVLCEPDGARLPLDEARTLALGLDMEPLAAIFLAMQDLFEPRDQEAPGKK